VNCCGNPTLPSVQSMADGWAKHDHCSATPVTTTLSPHIRLSTYRSCAPGSTVELYSVEGGGHTWPGATIIVPGLNATTHEIDASATIWAFFAAHPGPTG
jgi:polyhydroxybutyrate depolymerase